MSRHQSSKASDSDDVLLLDTGYVYPLRSEASRAGLPVKVKEVKEVKEVRIAATSDSSVCRQVPHYPFNMSP
jgi:hypothetical protein